MTRLAPLVLVSSLLLAIPLILAKGNLITRQKHSILVDNPIRAPATKQGVYECLRGFQKYTEATEGDYVIRLKSRTFIPEPNSSRSRECLEMANDGRPYYLIVQFWDVPTEEQKEQIQGSGFNLFGYLPNRAFFAQVTNFVDLPGDLVRWVGPIEPKDKLAPGLWDGEFGSWALEGEDVLLNVHVFGTADKLAFAQRLQNYFKAVILDERSSGDDFAGTTYYTVRLNKNKVRDLANSFDEVYQISVAPPPPVPH